MNSGNCLRLGRATLALALLTSGGGLCAQQATVTAQVEMTGVKPAKKSAAAARDLSGVVLWLAPANSRTVPAGDSKRPMPTITQQNKSFTPHVLAVQVGTSVLFPNKDRFLHNVFSLHDGRQFDLGFYEAGSAKSVRFDRAGVSFLFCNIHPEMAAAVIALETPYFATSDSSGRLIITGVAAGNYVLHVWSEQSLPEQLKNLEREVKVVPGDVNLGSIRLSANPNFTTAHKNKYGQDYVPPVSSEYGHP
jgi:plastocyanin